MVCVLAQLAGSSALQTSARICCRSARPWIFEIPRSALRLRRRCTSCGCECLDFRRDGCVDAEGLFDARATNSNTARENFRALCCVPRRTSSLLGAGRRSEPVPSSTRGRSRERPSRHRRRRSIFYSDREIFRDRGSWPRKCRDAFGQANVETNGLRIRAGCWPEIAGTASRAAIRPAFWMIACVKKK